MNRSSPSFVVELLVDVAVHPRLRAEEDVAVAAEGVEQPRAWPPHASTPVSSPSWKVSTSLLPQMLRLVRRRRAASPARSCRPGSPCRRRRRSRSRRSRRRSGRGGSSSCRTRSGRRRCRGCRSRRRCRCSRSARIWLFWCECDVVADAERRRCRSRRRSCPFGIERGASASLPGTRVVVLGEARGAVLDQVEVLVDRRRRLAHRDADVARASRARGRAAGRRRSRSGRCCRVASSATSSAFAASPAEPSMRRRVASRAARGVDLEVVRRTRRSSRRGRRCRSSGRARRRAGVVLRVDDRARRGCAARRCRSTGVVALGLDRRRRSGRRRPRRGRCRACCRRPPRCRPR